MESIKILCFGDSLTEGYSRWGMSMTPYADNMEEFMKAAWPSTRLTVHVNGMSGDLVVSGLFLKRITRSCQRAEDKYDWIIILGGTNDLGHGLKPDKIFAGLEKIYEVALDHGAKILALTVPECAVVNKSLDERRDRLNTLIKERKGDRFHVLDLHTLMPYHSMTDEESRDAIWDDGLHFTEHGYSVMGDHIASRLVELVTESQELTKLEVTEATDIMAEQGDVAKVA